MALAHFATLALKKTLFTLPDLNRQLTQAPPGQTLTHYLINLTTPTKIKIGKMVS
jgi:hypothetical protein